MLMRRLAKRGFDCDRPLLAVLDGSDALRSSVKEFFPDAIVQRCLVHKERNIRGKLSKKHWGELARLFRRLREVQGREAAEEVVGELESVRPSDAGQYCLRIGFSATGDGCTCSAQCLCRTLAVGV